MDTNGDQNHLQRNSDMKGRKHENIPKVYTKTNQTKAWKTTAKSDGKVSKEDGNMLNLPQEDPVLAKYILERWINKPSGKPPNLTSPDRTHYPQVPISSYITCNCVQSILSLPRWEERVDCTQQLVVSDDEVPIGQSRAVDKVLQQRENGFFIECGAGTGEQLSNSLFFEKSRGWTESFPVRTGQ